MDLHDWPEVPKALRPKNLFVDCNLDTEIRTQLASGGWNVIDTRVMPTRTDAERLEAFKAVLEGIRVGSIEGNKNLKDFLDLEAYALGVKGKTTQTVDKGVIESNELDVLLSFGDTSKVSQDFRDKLKALEDNPRKKKQARKKT